ncbi:hypothetical protein B4589_002825 [Halolamina sp. CBA1230]|uniref:DUF7287 family protein n=1 Tax=Halolamina sp. CBA1230 TaxID=1853690 RepID=UPI0009A222AF|nr:hypothetical protein [Halolamina sp. CBA1230]QKY19359.1 hypothetical protein B4589_002825 [Halolamina sp. CBA1230]
MSRRRVVDDDRGQMVLDYAIGVGIFLIAVTFVVATIPGMFSPFLGAGDTQVADRVATSMATERLGAPDEPYVLDRECTDAFFEQLDDDGTEPSAEDCRFDTNATSLQPMFGLDPGQSIQVRIESTSDGATLGTLEAGPDAPSSVSVTTARRIVTIDGSTYWLEVRAW